MASCLPAPPCHAGVDEDEDKTKARPKASLLPFPSPNSPSPNASSRTRTRSPTPAPPQDPRRRPLRPPPPPRLPTVIDRPKNHSCCWRQLVAGYFVLNAAADSSTLPLPEPQLIINAANLGIIASPTAFAGYMVAELQPFVGDDHATLLCFSSDVGEWVDKTISYPWSLGDQSNNPLPARPFSSHAVLSLHGRLCRPSRSTTARLPPCLTGTAPSGSATASCASSTCTEIGTPPARSRSPSGRTLPDPDSTEWALEHQASFHHIWAHPTYKAAGLPTKIPVLALIHPDNSAVVYFFLDHHLFVYIL
ncbi:hypothetical protein PAHAL_5G538900 [Panicum hallii]|uniref:Uncharacterized protein n=1 Tax=Panicum hallii TaxID=206008 RepID=A0A2T8IPH0_9POAL|nr:hypothetical protein PAHAL_5G538900 [Panicum hallii]